MNLAVHKVQLCSRKAAEDSTTLSLSTTMLGLTEVGGAGCGSSSQINGFGIWLTLVTMGLQERASGADREGIKS